MDIKKEDSKKNEDVGEEKRALISLLEKSVHKNGYIRESVLSQLAAKPSSETIRALVVRANDWVPVIRSRAKELLLNVICKRTCFEFAKSLDVIYHLRDCGRAAHASFIKDVEIRLLEYPHALLQVASNEKGLSSLYAAKLLSKCEVEELSESKLFQSLLCSAEPNVRIYSLRFLERVENPENFLTKLLKDPSPRVRKESLRKLLSINFSNGLKACEKMILDPHPGVRLLAMYSLRSAEIDCASIYRKNLESDSIPVVRASIWGLMNLFSKESLQDILPFLASSFPSVRLQALKACAVLAEDNKIKEIVTHLSKDNSPKVVKECTSILVKRDISIEESVLAALILGQKSEKNIKFLLQATHKMNKWQQFIFLNDLLSSGRAELIPALEFTLATWAEKMERCFTEPSEKQVCEINAFLKKHKKLWPVRVRLMVKHWLAIV